MILLKDSGGHPSGITIGIPMKDDKFNTWLKNRAQRLKKSPGFDDPRKSVQKEVKNVKLTDQLPAVIEKSLPPSNEERSGRVVHWSRSPLTPNQ